MMSLLGCFALQTEDVKLPGFNATKWAESLQTAIAQLADLRMDGLRKKASESDPQKRIYGPAMSAKVPFSSSHHSALCMQRLRWPCCQGQC